MTVDKNGVKRYKQKSQKALTGIVFLTTVDIRGVLTAQTVAVEELGEGALLQEVGLALFGAVVVQLAFSRVRKHGRLVLLTSLFHRRRLWGGGAGS